MTYPTAGDNPDFGLPPRSISNIPVPDPSDRTIIAISNEIANLRELLQSRLDQNEATAVAYQVSSQRALDAAQVANNKAIDAALLTSNAAISAALATADKAITELDASIGRRIEALSDLTDSKFITFRTLVDSESNKVALALDSTTRAIDKSDLATEKRFENVNEFRGQLNDQTKTFISRSEYEATIHSITEKIDDLKSFRDSNIGAARVIPAPSHEIRMLQDKIDVLASYKDNSQGKSIGANAVYGYVVGGCGFAIAVVLFVLQIAGAK